LQGDGAFVPIGQGTAEIMPVAPHGKCGRPDRTAEIERKDLGIRVAPELQRHQCQQHRLSSTGRTHHEGMADVADVEGESEWGRALGFAKQEWRPLEVQIPRLARPHSRHRNHMGQIEGRYRRLPHIGIDMSRQAAEPGFDGVRRALHLSSLWILI
jgi:hypothetical protein